MHVGIQGRLKGMLTTASQKRLLKTGSAPNTLRCGVGFTSNALGALLPEFKPWENLG
jgi:hypothetical protein